MNDWQGRPIPIDEPKDKIIKVWQFEPGIDSDHDSVVVRGYQDACAFAESHIVNLMDSAENLEGDGINIKIKLIDMSLEDYEEAQNQDH